MKLATAIGSILLLVVSANLSGMPAEPKSACVQNKGDTLIKGTFWVYSSKRFWDASGKNQSAYNDFEIREYLFYLEHGLTCNDTVSVRGGWARIEESINGRTFGFEDLEVGWKHCFGEKWGHLFSVELLGIVPIETSHKPGVRYGEYGGECNLLFSRGFTFCDRCGSYDVRAGYRTYEGFPSDQIRTDGAVKFFPLSRLMITASGHLEYGLFNGHSRTDESLFLLNPNYRLFRAQIEATLCIFKRFFPFIGYQRHVWGRNVGTGGGIYGGVQVQF